MTKPTASSRRAPPRDGHHEGRTRRVARIAVGLVTAALMMASGSLAHAITIVDDGCIVDCTSIDVLTFLDGDANGVFGPTELEQTFVGVQLLTTEVPGSGIITPGAPVLLSSTTDTDGRLRFQGLAANLDYFLRFQDLSSFGFNYTLNDVGDNDFDSDVGPDGNTGVCFLTPGVSWSVAGGYTAPGSTSPPASTPVATCPPPLPTMDPPPVTAATPGSLGLLAAGALLLLGGRIREGVAPA